MICQMILWSFVGYSLVFSIYSPGPARARVPVPLPPHVAQLGPRCSQFKAPAGSWLATAGPKPGGIFLQPGCGQEVGSLAGDPKRMPPGWGWGPSGAPSYNMEASLLSGRWGPSIQLAEGSKSTWMALLYSELNLLSMLIVPVNG